jgi:hypothetical protein
MKTTTVISRDSISCAPCRLALLLIPLALACFTLSPSARAVCQDACLGSNTVQGEDALLSLTTGLGDTAIGFFALLSNTTGSDNTAIGDRALQSNTTGHNNTATGNAALIVNTTGFDNTATGDAALWSNNGSDNTATGTSALYFNTSGLNNTASGSFALFVNRTGSNNTATGASALWNNATGANNTASGSFALLRNIGGSSNIALGFNAGANLTTGDNNIDIGNIGKAGESATIRIGTVGTQTATYIAGIAGTPIAGGVAVGVTADGQLGVRPSSARFKERIKPMDKASEAILALKPVTFRYKKDLDPKAIPQFGLVAEEVEKVNSDLVARDERGKPYTVRYEAVNAMLLNEFLKEHKKVAELEATVSKLQAQGKEIAELKAALKQQAAQLQKVGAWLEANTPATRLVDNQ